MITYCTDNKCKINFKCTRYSPIEMQNKQNNNETFYYYSSTPIKNSDGTCPAFIERIISGDKRV